MERVIFTQYNYQFALREHLQIVEKIIDGKQNCNEILEEISPQM